MAAQALTNVQVLVGSVDLSPFSGSIDPTGSTEMKPADNFAAGGYAVVLPGLSTFETAIAGNADYATGGINQTFSDAQRGQQYAYGIAYAGTAATFGDAAVFSRGLLQSLKFATGKVGDVAQFAMGLKSDTAQIGGVVGAPLVSRTTSGLTGTAIAMAGPTANQKLYAGLYVTAAAGTNLAVKVQSDDNSGFTSATDRITFSTVSATGWQFSSVAGDFSTETHLRVTATIASSTFSFAVFLGVM
jgi:hypothetical protein